MYIQAKLVNGEVIEQFVDSNICVIGRSSKCDVVIPHEGMSRQHCQIELVNGEYFVTDLGSTNGVLIDNQKIEPHQKIPYQTFLPLSFGAVQNFLIAEETGGHETEVANGSMVSDSSSPTRSMKQIPKSAGNHSNPEVKIIPENDKSEKLKTWTINILAILLVIAAFAWYMFREEAEMTLDTIQGNNAEIPENPF